MSQGEGYPEPGLPTSHYFLSLSRGDTIRTVMLRPASLWALAALTALLIVWASAVSAYIALHDDLLSAVVARQAAMESAHESRLAEARARLDEVGGQRALDLKSFARKLSELASRQARLEKRGAVVAALAAESEGRNPSAHEGRPAQASPVPAADALGAIRALGPPLPAEGDAGSARAYAPLPGLSAEPGAMKPHRVDERGETLSAPPAPSPTAAADDLDAAARSAIIDRSLDQMDSGQMKALAAIGRSAERAVSRDAGIVAKIGLDPAKLAPPHAEGGVGGPFIPAEVDPNAPAFDQALTRAARDVAMAERLKARGIAFGIPPPHWPGFAF